MQKCQFKARCGGGKRCEECRFSYETKQEGSNLGLKPEDVKRQEDIKKVKEAETKFKGLQTTP